MRRMVSLPPVATLTESNDSEDDDGEDEIDDTASVSGSHITRPSVSAAFGSPKSAVSVGNASASSPYSPTRPPPSTQAVSPGGLTLGGSNRLALLNKPGKGQAQTNVAGPSRSGSGSGTGMPPPSQSASQMTKDRVASSSSAQPDVPRSRPHPFRSMMMSSQSIITDGPNKATFNKPRALGSAGPPNKNSTQSFFHAQPSSSRSPPASQPQPRPRISSSVSAPPLTQPAKTSSTSGSSKGKEKEIYIEISDSDDDRMGAPPTPVPPRPKPRKKPDTPGRSPVQSKSPQKRNSIEDTLSTSSGDEFPFSISRTVRRPDKSQSPAKPASTIFSMSNGPRRVQHEDNIDDVASSISQASRKRVPDNQRAAHSSSAPGNRTERNKAAPEVQPNPTSCSASGSTPRRRRVSICRKTTGGIPRLHARHPSSGSDQNEANARPRKESVSEIGSLRSENPAARISRKTTGGRRPDLHPPSSPCNIEDELNAASRIPVIVKTKVPSKTQPTSNRAGPSRPPSSTQPSSNNNGKAAPNRSLPSTQRPRAPTRPVSSSLDKNKGPKQFLGVFELSDDEDTRPSAKGSKSVTKDGGVIDLTQDDDDDIELLPEPAPSSKSAVPLNDIIPSNIATSTDPNKPVTSESRVTGSPPAVRPKPRVSAIPKEKMAAPKAQPAQSRPLDVSRRRSGPAGGGDGKSPTSSWLLDDSGSDTEPARTELSKADAGAVTSHSRARQTSKKQDEPAADCQAHTVQVPVPPVPNASSLPIQAAEESEDAELNFDALNDEPMDIEPLYDDDGAVMNAPEAALASDGVADQLDNTVSSPEPQADGTALRKPEETAAPVERARELRSPPPAEQAKEVQSQAEDANEVDLLLGPAFDSDVAEIEKLQGRQSIIPDSSTVEAGVKPPTLTDKLGMLDLSRPAGASSNAQDQKADSDVEMESDEDSRTAEDSGTVPSAHAVVVPATSPSKTTASEEAESSALQDAASTATSPPPPSSSTSDLAPQMTMSSPMSPEEDIPASSASSSGASHTPELTSNLKDISYGKHTAPSPVSPSSRFKLPMRAIDEKPVESGESGISALPSKVSDKVASGGDTHSRSTAPIEPTSHTNGAATSETVSKSGETGVSKGSTVVNRDESSTPSGSSGLEDHSSNPLSPKSRAKLRIPDVRPRRSLNIGQPDTLARIRAEAKAITDRSSLSSSPPVSGLPKFNERQQNTTAGIVKSSPEAVASARKLAELYPAFKDAAKAKTIATPVTNLSRRAGLSGPDTMTYVKNMMKKHTSDSSASCSPVNGTSPLPGQIDPTSQPISPKRQKTFHTPDSQRADLSISTTVVAGNSEETKIDTESIILSGGSSESVGVSTKDTSTGPSLLAAPHTRHQVARKSAPKRRLKVTSSASDPAVRSIGQSLKESRISSSVSQAQPRKRTLSSTSQVPSVDGDELQISYKRKVSFKRPRIRDSDEEDSSAKDDVQLRRRLRQTRRPSGISGDEGLSSCSIDPIDLIDTDDTPDEGSDSSAVQPTTPVSGLAGAIRDIVISKSPGYRGGVEVDRYFMDRDRGPVWYHVDDIPTELINEVNAIPVWGKNPMVLRQMFQTVILQNTIEDEPNAPVIEIVNEIDDEPTPPFEFYYTNRIYHGHGVPPPDYENLQGCNCIGRCNPLSEKCACAVRQREAFDKQGFDYQGFAYDNKGRSQMEGFPIFECNDACGCTEDCTNRVVQLGRKCHVKIVKTKNKGWGVFAARKILRGTFIGVYSGEILLQSESEMRGHLYNKIGKTYLFDIDFYHVKDEDQDAKYTMDAYHVGNFTRFLNHSCDPNCRINAVHINDANLEKALLGIFALKDIDAGQELTFNYYGEMDDGDMDKGENQAYQKCLCGARNCVGKLFTFSNAPTE